mmetsp:Transcript_32095/g.62754  ORF Transcript_32095/g.62754 Transcript_32095/m.62754 type:complete len:104 (-) Transcript_32095:74-385(-)
MAPSLAEQVINSIFEQGINKGTITVLNYVILALVLSIGLAIATGSGNIHVYILLALSIGLCLSVNYYVGLLRAHGAEKAASEGKTEAKTSVPKRKRSRSKKAD